jgi:hypothetical protein
LKLASLVAHRSFWLRLALVITVTTHARTAAAQAWVLPERTGAVTFTSMLFTDRGSDAHDIHVFSVTAGRVFEIGR